MHSSLPDTCAATGAAARAALGPLSDVCRISVLDEVDSTNTLAKATAATDDTPALILARTQTGGRGRMGRSFHSPADTGLYMTYAYTTAEPLTEAVRVTALAAVAAVSAMEALTDKRPAIKWVNDLYLNGGKLGGILTEAVTRPDGATRMIVGLGINLTTEHFPEGLRAPAVSLFGSADAHLATPALQGTLAGEIARRLAALLQGSASILQGSASILRGDTTPPQGDVSTPLAFYRAHLLYVGMPVLCTRGGESFEGVITGVSEDYALQLSVDGSPVTLSSGEISLRPI